MTARWSLVSTMHGVPETILPCIAHHLQSDAEFLHIYLDAPNPVVEAALATQPRCRVTVCDDRYWSSRPVPRPPGVVGRQRANLEHAKHHADSEWLVHVDSDEFLVGKSFDTPLSLGMELATVPEQHDWARIFPLERVLPPGMVQKSIFDGIFRKRTTDHQAIADAYQENAVFLKKGLSGHSRGKIAFRRETQLVPRLHDLVWPVDFGKKRPKIFRIKDLPPFTALPETYILHFEGWTAYQWVKKLMRFVDAKAIKGHNAGRQAAIAHLGAHNSENDRLALFDTVQRLSPTGFEVLKQAGYLRLDAFDPTNLTRRTFPMVNFDFSVAGLDAKLQASDTNILQKASP